MDLDFRKLDLDLDKVEYLEAWRLAFERDTDDERIDWCVFSDKNYTFVVKD